MFLNELQVVQAASRGRPELDALSLTSCHIGHTGQSKGRLTDSIVEHIQALMSSRHTKKGFKEKASFFFQWHILYIWLLLA